MKYTIILFFLLLACSENKIEPTNSVSWSFSVASTAKSPAISGNFSLKLRDTDIYTIEKGGKFTIDGKTYETVEITLPKLNNKTTSFSLRNDLGTNTNEIAFTGKVGESTIEASSVIVSTYNPTNGYSVANFVINKK